MALTLVKLLTFLFLYFFLLFFNFVYNHLFTFLELTRFFYTLLLFWSILRILGWKRGFKRNNSENVCKDFQKAFAMISILRWRNSFTFLSLPYYPWFALHLNHSPPLHWLAVSCLPVVFTSSGMSLSNANLQNVAQVHIGWFIMWHDSKTTLTLLYLVNILSEILSAKD